MRISKFVCETKREGRWVAIGLEEAARFRNEVPLRCSACHGAVHTRRRYTEVSQPFIEHVQAHASCANTRGCVWPATLHPEALA